MVIQSQLPEIQTSHDLALKQSESLAVLAKATNDIATFITSGGLTQLLSGYARSQAVKDILGGLAAHDGRNALDARVLGQNSIEIVEQVERVFAKYEERLAAKLRGEERDPDMHEATEEYRPRVKREIDE